MSEILKNLVIRANLQENAFFIYVDTVSFHGGLARC